MPEISGYAFPNDVHVHWSLMIVMYPYITGFVAGSFIVTALYHLFGKKSSSRWRGSPSPPPSASC